MLHKILIANRGEIACRVIKTAKKMGIQCVAIYSSADENALHVQQADEAYYVGNAPSQESYLCIDKIIEIAKRANVNAIHPGYGFLSENAAFAQRCIDNNICFIGPPPGAIIAMGSKATAKKIMEKANVPLVAGYHGDDQKNVTLMQAAAKIGYPVLLKATAGGGGKGMRIIYQAVEFTDALLSAKREAKASFADDRMLIEKYLVAPRHIEIQVFADRHNHFVHLFERDCSIQRRHQKVLEEAPAPDLSDELREKMGQAAINAAKAIGYVGAGTVEFLLDEMGKFYFMEMNTRLQVEHPITEMITGIDLVEWQLRIASGEPLPLAQEDIKKQGHAIEARIYAEDPDNHFLPMTGTLHHLRFPRSSEHVRIDTGVQEDDIISPYYDPMIAKLIVWDENRTKALHRLDKALSQCHLAGLGTNIDFLRRICQHPAYRQGQLTTHFIADHNSELLGTFHQDIEQMLALACLYRLLSRQKTASALAMHDADPYSPWHQQSGWRLNDSYQESMEFVIGHQPYNVIIDYLGLDYRLRFAKDEKIVRGELLSPYELRATLDGKKITVSLVQQGYELIIFGDHFHCRIGLKDLMPIHIDESDATEAKLIAPMPGTVVAVMVNKDEMVSKGDSLLIIEAMKMEHTITAPIAATVKEIYFKQGEQVKSGVQLLELIPLTESTPNKMDKT